MPSSSEWLDRDSICGPSFLISTSCIFIKGISPKKLCLLSDAGEISSPSKFKDSNEFRDSSPGGTPCCPSFKSGQQIPLILLCSTSSKLSCLGFADIIKSEGCFDIDRFSPNLGLTKERSSSTNP
ncbi:hypothetical protein V8G54_027960 [Vigna mungo]|uniref:Uncharacterized protein n=1 Tax=Vigna mungo TaxID=3915 RepID=A0AAQ3MS39_VIGMU